MFIQPETADWLRYRSYATPTKTALLFGEERWTFAELDILTDQLCGWLSQWDLPKNRRVGVLMHNSLEYVLLIYAAARLNLTLVTFNSRLTSAEVEWQIGFTQCGVVLVDEANSEKVHSAQKLSIGNWQLTTTCPWGIDNFDRNPSINSNNATQSIVFTSGTTGRPKAVPIRFEQHFYSAMASAYRLGVEHDDVWLSVLPLYHVGGMAVIFRSLLYGTAVDLHQRFDLEQINHALDNKPISMISVVPTMLYRLTETRQTWPDSMRLILVGGAAASPELVEAAGKLSRDGKPLVATSYGLTEVASQFATQTPTDTLKKPGSVGRPFLFNELRIVRDENDNGQHTAGNGERKTDRSTDPLIGEIQIRGPVLMAGYLDNPAVNSERFSADGWFATGDLGYLDADGDLYVVQRRSDLIISGGENVYPAEVEAALREHPAVKEACVIGLPDAEWGQIVAAMVEFLPEQQLTSGELIGFSQQTLARYKQPRFIELVAQLPQTASGKIERKQVESLLKEKFSLDNK